MKELMEGLKQRAKAAKKSNDLEELYRVAMDAINGLEYINNTAYYTCSKCRRCCSHSEMEIITRGNCFCRKCFRHGETITSLPS